MFWRSLAAAVILSLLGHAPAWAVCSQVYPFTRNCILPTAGLNAAFAGLTSSIATVAAGALTTSASNAVLPTARTNLGAAAADSPAFSGTASGTYTLGGTPRISGTGTYDLATISNPMRYALWNLTLTPSVNTSNIWEGLGVFYTLNGPGHANGEINHFHANFTVASGAVSVQSEGYEAKLENAGTVTEWNGALLIPQNGAAGTATTLYGAKCQLTQANAAGAAVATYACLNNEAVTGGGSQPTANLFLRNADANAYSATLGHINIGTLSDNGVPLFVLGSGSTNATFPLVIKNSSSSNVFFCQDDSSCTAAGVFSINGVAKLPNVGTGTPAASLCIDASNNVIKKTTGGSCV